MTKELVYEVSHGEESYSKVYMTEAGMFEVWDIPLYGGEERFEDERRTLDEATKLADSFC